MEYLIANIGNAVTFATWVVAVTLSLIATHLIVRLFVLRHVNKQPSKYIEVVPPYNFNKTPEATEQLFTMMHSISSARKLRHRILRLPIILSLEVISTRKEGVRYIVRTNLKEYETVRRHISAFMPDGRIKDIPDPLIKSTHSLVRDYRQTKHFAFALRTFASFDQHDPIAYVTGLMSRLNDSEQIALQIVITPVKVRNMRAVVHKFHEFYKVSDMSHNKAYSRLFRTDLRIRIVTDNEEMLEEQRAGLDGALQSFSIERIQSLKARYNFMRGRYREYLFTHRLPALYPRLSNIFSSLELANIYHFPGTSTKTENLNRSLSRTLAPPLSIRNNQDFSFIIGETNHGNEKLLIGLTEEERNKHVYIVGGTGNGKTTVIQNAVINDIKNGKGVAVLDPHGDMAEELLRHIPEKRIKDVVYFNPIDIEHPIGFNPLEVDPNLTGSALRLERERVTESVVSMLRKIFSDNDTGGSRIESMLRNAIHTAFESENPTLFTIYKIINDDKFRSKLVSKLDNEYLKDFWLNEYGKAGGMQQVSMAKGVTSKITRFIFSETAQSVMGQVKSTINFNDIADTGKILICNLSKGNLGDDTSALFGVSIMAQIQRTALYRSRLKKQTRLPFYVYVDEFQNFATPSFIQMLDEARKFKILLVMAQQSLSQQDHNLSVRILGNASTVIVFRTGNPDDERMLLPFFEPYIQKNEILSLPTYNFYARLAAVKAQEPVSGTTILIEDKGDDTIAERVKASSQKLYAGKSPIIEPSEAPQSTQRPETGISSSGQEEPSIDDLDPDSLLSQEQL